MAAQMWGLFEGTKEIARSTDFAALFDRTSGLNSGAHRHVEPIPELILEGASSALKDVVAERERQMNDEGWTSDHDDAHAEGELAAAAACYALSDTKLGFALTLFWPWSIKWWKPTVPRRDLVKAAALILAEIERLDRKA